MCNIIIIYTTHEYIKNIYNILYVIYTFFRIATFQKKTEPIISIFKNKNKYQRIKSDGAREQITNELIKLIDPYYKWYLLKSCAWFPSAMDNELIMNLYVKNSLLIVKFMEKLPKIGQLDWFRKSMSHSESSAHGSDESKQQV